MTKISDFLHFSSDGTFGSTHNGRPSRRESGTAFYDGQCFVIEHGGVHIIFILCDWHQPPDCVAGQERIVCYILRIG